MNMMRLAFLIFPTYIFVPLCTAIEFRAIAGDGSINVDVAAKSSNKRPSMMRKNEKNMFEVDASGGAAVATTGAKLRR